MGTQLFISGVVAIICHLRPSRLSTGLAFVLILSSAVLSFAPAAVAGARDGSSGPATAPSAQSGDTVIPLSRWGNLYLVKAAINFQKIGYLILDTGDTTTTIDHDLVSHLKLPVLGNADVNGGSGKMKVEMARIDDLSVGDVPMRNAAVISTDISRYFNLGMPFAGMLGLDFLRQQPFTLDCHRDLLILHRPESFMPPRADSSQSFPLDNLEEVGLAIQGKIDGHEGWFYIDSGDEMGVEIYQPFMILSRLQRPEHQYRFEGLDMQVGPPQAEDRNWYSSFEIFGRKSAGVWASFEPNAPVTEVQRVVAGRIGMGTMSDGIFTFDMANRRLWVQWPARETTDEMVKRLGDPHSTDLKGMTPLMRAARAGRADVVQRLLKAGADPSTMRPVFTATALTEAIDSDQPDVVQALLAGGAPVDQAINSHHVTPLHYAANRGNVRIAELLLKAGASVSATDDEGRTPLHLSVWTNHLEVAKALIASHAPVEAKDNRGYTPLIYASASGDPRIVAAVIAGGADINESDSTGATALHTAANASLFEVTKWLLDHGASVNALTHGGVTPLIYAATHDDSDVVRVLLEHGADVSHKDGKGKSAIDYAIINGRGVIVKMLLDHLSIAPKDAPR